MQTNKRIKYGTPHSSAGPLPWRDHRQIYNFILGDNQHTVAIAGVGAAGKPSTAGERGSELEALPATWSRWNTYLRAWE